MTDKTNKEWLRGLKAEDSVILHTGSSKDDYYVIRRVSGISPAGFIKVGYDLFNPETGIARGSSCACILPTDAVDNLEKVIRQGIQLCWFNDTNYAQQRSELNINILHNLQEKYEITSHSLRHFIERADVALRLCYIGAGIKRYKVVKNEPELSDNELALIADNGSLCFGYRMENDRIIIYTE